MKTHRRVAVPRQAAEVLAGRVLAGDRGAWVGNRENAALNADLAKVRARSRARVAARAGRAAIPAGPAGVEHHLTEAGDAERAEEVRQLSALEALQNDGGEVLGLRSARTGGVNHRHGNAVGLEVRDEEVRHEEAATAYGMPSDRQVDLVCCAEVAGHGSNCADREDRGDSEILQFEHMLPFSQLGF